MAILATFHVMCSFPGCGHTAVMQESFNWPLVGAPDAEIPQGWSVVLRRVGESIVVLAVCREHDFAFDGAKSSAIKPIGFNNEKGGAAE